MRTMVISCFSFAEGAKRVTELMTEWRRDADADSITAAIAPCPPYVMGLVKAALECRALPRGRFWQAEDPVNAISAGPIRHACRRHLRCVYVRLPAAYSPGAVADTGRTR